MICPNCESENRDQAKYCDQCGFPLTGAIARAAEAARDEQLDEAADEKGLDDAVSHAEPDDVEAPGVDPNDVTKPLDAIEAEDGEVENGEDPFEPNACELEPEPDQADDGFEPEQADEIAAADDGRDEDERDPEAEIPQTGEQPDVELDDSAGGSSLYGGGGLYDDYEPPQAEVTAQLHPDTVSRVAMPFAARDGQTMQMPRIEDETPVVSTDYLASQDVPQKPRSKKVPIAIALALVACAAIAVFATYQLEIWGGKAVPDVVGMTEADATSTLSEDGFEVRVTHVKSDGTEGLVLVMDPSSGSRVEEGSEVIIHLSVSREIPEVVGLPQEEAAALLAEEGFENVVFEDEKSDEAEDTVLSVDPEVGMRARSTQPVTVKVADPYVVPAVSDFGFDDAVAAIVDEGLTYEVVTINTMDYPEGAIMGTEPAAGTKVPGGSLVVIQLAHARGDELVDLTSNLLAPGQTFNMRGTSYEVQSLNSLVYIGDDVVSFEVTAMPYINLLDETVYISARPIVGRVTWTADNEVVSIM